MVTDVLERIDGVLPAIRARRAEIESGRRLPPDLVELLQNTGVFSMSVPRAVGGTEARLTEIMSAIERVASVDGSAGWCTMIGITSNTAAGYLSDSGAKEIFADPNVLVAAVAAPAGQAVPCDGGLRVSGRWPFASGVTHSEWVWAGAAIMDGAQPRMTPQGPAIAHMFMPARDIEIHDTWFVSGLCGTGSNDISATEVDVPESRVFALFDPSEHRPEPLYQLSPAGLFVAEVASVSLGVARAAIDEFVALAPTKTPAMSSAALADKPVAQIEIARIEARLQAARSFLYGAVDDIWQTLADGTPYTMRQEALVRAAGLNAVETAARGTATINTLGGSSSIYSSSSLQRHARDAEAITHHFTAAPHVWEDVGRVFLGLAPTMPVF
jgi:alkylation response protein AidB-like acyl-CoA dehydrogenase